MKFGIFSLPTYFPETDGSLEQFYERLIELFVRSEEQGFDSCWVNEHHYHAFGGMIPSPPVVLAAVAALTSRIRLGASIAIVPLHPPLELAEQYAMLDQLSGGRVEFGFGKGFVQRDYDILNVPWEEGHERMKEIIDILIRAWGGKSFSHQGKFYSFKDIALWPKPQQQPYPPIWGAGTRSAESFRWFGERGFHLMTTAYLSPMEKVAALVEEYRSAARGAGHRAENLEVSIQFQVFCHEDRAYARSVAERAARRYVELLNEARAEGNTPLIPIDDVPFDQLIDLGRICAGTPEDCVDIIDRAREQLGLTQVYGTFYFGGISYEEAEASVALFASDVIPRLKADSTAGETSRR